MSLVRSLKQQQIETDGAGRRMTGSAQIARTLREWQDRPHQLSVAIGKETYGSRIAQVDPSRLLIDTLLPKSGDAWVEKRPVARFQCRVLEEGVERICTFESTLQEILSYQGLPSIQVAFPNELYQKVERYYAQPGEEETLWVRFELHGRWVEQKLTEISLYDARFRAKLGVRGGKPIPRMAIQFPDGVEVIGEAVLQRLRLYDYALEYAEVSQEGQQLLSRYISERYREERGIAPIVLSPIRSASGLRRRSRRSRGERAKVLLLERDDEVIRRVQRALETRGNLSIVIKRDYDEQVVDRVMHDRPHLILMGIHMANPDDLTLMEAMKATPSPLVALIDPSGGEKELEALPWGILDYVLKPLDMEELLHRIEVILHLEGFASHWGEPLRKALVFGGQGEASYDIKTWAAQWDYTLEWVKEEAEGVRQAQEVRPDVILIDKEGLSMDSRSICRALRMHSTTSSIPVVVIQPKGRWDGLEDLPNVACIQRPVDPLHLMERVGWMSTRTQEHPPTLFGLSAFIDRKKGRTDGE